MDDSLRDAASRGPGARRALLCPGPADRHGIPGREERIVAMVNTHETVASTGLDNSHDGFRLMNRLGASCPVD